MRVAMMVETASRIRQCGKKLLNSHHHGLIFWCSGRSGRVQTFLVDNKTCSGIDQRGSVHPFLSFGIPELLKLLVTNRTNYLCLVGNNTWLWNLDLSLFSFSLEERSGSFLSGVSRLRFDPVLIKS